MYCPDCGYEYREGFSRCPDCDVELVSELPDEDTAEHLEFEEVLSASSLADIAIIKSLLNGEGITYYFANENMFSSIPAPALPATLMVLNDHVRAAREILRDVELSYMASSLGEDEGVD